MGSANSRQCLVFLRAWRGSKSIAAICGRTKLANAFSLAAKASKRIWPNARSKMGGSKPAVCQPPKWENIPPELTALPQWVLWRWVERGGKPTKPPYQPDGSHARVDDPSTWSPFEYVQTAFETAPSNHTFFHGVGFVLTEQAGFTAFDFDNCLDADFQIVDSRVAQWVRALDSYTEISPSGRGLRVLVRAKLPAGARKAGNCECYDTGRYVTLTGRLFPR
jgi:primase-polymerase (primpol)-like protein